MQAVEKWDHIASHTPNLLHAIHAIHASLRPAAKRLAYFIIPHRCMVSS
jgi:hypothetical protein